MKKPWLEIWPRSTLPLTARPLASFSAASWRRLRSAMSSFLTASTNGVEKPATQEGVEDCASSVSSSPVPTDLRPTNSTPKRRSEEEPITSSQPREEGAAEAEAASETRQPAPPVAPKDPPLPPNSESAKRARTGDLVRDTTTALQRVKVEMSRFADFISDTVPQSEREEDVVDGARIAYLSLLGDQLKQISADWPRYS